ncbi:hypothetical protein IJ707_07960, partial [bacterium]|nr:hypothetical protein [bacterium]
MSVLEKIRTNLETMDSKLTEKENKSEYKTDSELLEIDKEYCTYGDKIHSEPVPKIFRDCNGIYMYDSENT